MYFLPMKLTSNYSLRRGAHLLKGIAETLHDTQVHLACQFVLFVSGLIVVLLFALNRQVPASGADSLVLCIV